MSASTEETTSLQALALQFLTAIYGGFFGADIGAVMLGALGVT
jgi:hypothetical protein